VTSPEPSRRAHVVLVTYGEPTSPAFLEQLVYSWRILLGLTRTVANIPAPLLPLIALSRARGRTALWKRHGYVSPLEPITLAQVAQLRHALAHASDREWKVHAAYEFRAPLIGEVIQSLPATDPVVIAPMYAADSAFTHGLSRRTAEQLDARRPAPIIVLPPSDIDTLAKLSADHVMHSIAGERIATANTALVLAAHGTLLEPDMPIETGRIATERLCAGIRGRLSGRFGMIANGWLNHSRGGKWTEPPIEQTLRQVRDAGYRDVVYYPYGFLADNAETQLEGKLAATGQPELRVRFVPCLNGSPDLAEAIAAQIVRAS
jgi:protoheme ferro-lyase